MGNSVVNDFSLRIATANGTGSQTSNNLIFRTLFRMGLAANTKNLFPSNIQGLPTWYQIRVSPEGYQVRSETWQVLVALNAATLDQDLKQLPKGQVVIDNADFKRADENFEGWIRYSVPFDTLARKEIADAKLRPRLKNMIYVGVVAELFGLDEDCLRESLTQIFRGKEKVVDINWQALQLGVQYVRDNFEKQDPYQLEKADQTAGKVAMEGNDAAALGVLYGGCSVVAWYPITPASSLADYLIGHAERLEKETGKRQLAVLQAEDELAAVGMALGAGWAGARSMTSTSGPGISLMGENMGLGYYAEIPTVIFNVQRVGPSTGLPTRTQQSDLLQAAYLSHGDTRFPILLPSDPKEAFELSWQAFDYAERFQVPVFVLSDLDLGMNAWVGDPPVYPDTPVDRGKVITDEKLQELETWGRYLDIDGDAIPWRSVPGRAKDPRSVFFTRGSGHNEMATYTEDPATYTRNLERLVRKIDSMGNALPAPIAGGQSDASVGVIAYGSTDPALQEALTSFPGVFASLRIRGFPFHDDVRSFIDSKEHVVVVEQNQQGQMAQLLRSQYPDLASRIDSARYYAGLPISAEFVRGALEPHVTKAK